VALFVAGGRSTRTRAGAAAPAQTEGLIDLGAHVRFRHPLVRSAVYQAAPVFDRQEVHRALQKLDMTSRNQLGGVPSGFLGSA
jgi:hypothetical protein